MKKFLKRVKKSFSYGEKGFTLIELLIVIAVLGALAAVVVPAVGSFLTSSKVTAANTEAQNVKTAAMSYLADKGVLPTSSSQLTGYISETPTYGVYTMDNTSGKITAATKTLTNETDMAWDCPHQVWIKGTAAVSCP